MNSTTKTDTVPVNNKITVDTEELMQLLSVGRHTAVKVGLAAGARIQYGRRVMWNLQRVNEYLNSIAE